MKKRLDIICINCWNEGSIFQDDDSIKLYHSVLLADPNCGIKERSIQCEYSVDLKLFKYIMCNESLWLEHLVKKKLFT